MRVPTPARMAERLIAEAPDQDWLRDLTDELDRQLRTAPLDRFMVLWDLSASEVARAFGISRQAVSKWLRDGVPAERAPALADLAAATDMLDRFVRRERISAVVRRPAAMLQDCSLYDMVAEGRHAEVLHAVTAMFDLGRIQP
jgi:transcriptional regulator with XRE-family HTH domain